MPQDSSHRNEILVVRGLLDRLGQFQRRRCYSTRFVRRAPEPSNENYVLELLDSTGKAIVNSIASVTALSHCGPGETQYWSVVGYIGLHNDGTEVVLKRNGLVLWQTRIPSAPTLKVTLTRGVISREKAVELNLKYSAPGDDAFFQVVYQWGPRQFQVLKFVKPVARLKVKMSDLPGGNSCHFVVHYSNGVRSAAASTRGFTLPLRGPRLTILEPASDVSIVEGQIIELAGQVVDPERPVTSQLAQADLTWWLGEQEIGRGSIATVMNAVPGRHRLTLRYRNSSAEAYIRVTVRPRESESLLQANHWPILERTRY
jgi:hypothetical protein